MSTQIVHLAAAWCLAYPDDALRQRLPALQAAVEDLAPGPARAGLLGFVRYARGAPLPQLQQQYVDVFDLSGQRALYLSYWTDGDTRRRGEALAAVKRRYRDSGWLVNMHGELPDYLPMVLEYAALADPIDGLRLLQEYRPSVELIRFALGDLGTPYAGLLDAVCSTLPGPSPADRAAVHRMAAAGPPAESVGLAASVGPALSVGVPSSGGSR